MCYSNGVDIRLVGCRCDITDSIDRLGRRSRLWDIMDQTTMNKIITLNLTDS